MRRPLWMLLLAVVASLMLVGTTLARHVPVGLVIDSVTRGTLAEEVDFKLGGIEVETGGAVDVVVVEATFLKNGGSAGWHVHPGAVFVVIRSGTLSVWDEHCNKTTYSPGETFFEAGPRHSMLVKNQGTEDATVYATFVVPVGATPLSVPARHRCGVSG